MVLEIEDPKEIREIRKKLGITQSELSKQANVSQSLIAKIEAGRIDPTYTKLKSIVSALSGFGKRKELKAGQIMNPKIISVEPDDNIKEVIAKMKRHGISQLPVIEEHKSIGIVSEATLLDAILNKKGKHVKDIMEDSPPIVSKNSSAGIVANLLKFYPMVLVSEDGKLRGVITKSDLLGKMYRS